VRPLLLLLLLLQNVNFMSIAAQTRRLRRLHA
jgi:hypothetical protein